MSPSNQERDPRRRRAVAFDVESLEERNMSDMAERFVVEADKKVVGIAVKVPGGYRFYSSDPDFLAMEGTTFPRAKAMAQRVAQIVKLRNMREVDSPPSLH